MKEREREREGGGGGGIFCSFFRLPLPPNLRLLRRFFFPGCKHTICFCFSFCFSTS